MIHQTVLLPGLQHSQDHAHGQRDGHGDQSQPHGDGELAGHDAPHRNTSLNPPRLTEVQTNETPIEPEQLCGYRVQQARGLQHVVLCLLVVLHLLLLSEVVIRGEHAHEHKDDGDNDENRQKGLQQPLDRVLSHQLLALKFSTN